MRLFITMILFAACQICPAIGEEANAPTVVIKFNALQELAIAELKGFIDASRNPDESFNIHKSTEIFREYRQEVAKLGQAVNEELAAKISAKADLTLDEALALMAFRIEQKPELLDEVINKALAKDPLSIPNRGGSHPVALTDEFAQEKYRSSWEFLLLAPWTKQVKWMNKRSHFFIALLRIKNWQSMPLLDYELELRIKHNIYQKDREAFASSFLTYFASNHALDYMLLQLARFRMPNGEFELVGSFFDARTYFIYMIAHRGFFKVNPRIKPQAWKKVVEDYNREGLEDWQVDFLEKMLEIIDNPGKPSDGAFFPKY